jgi:Lon protease-like protein
MLPDGRANLLTTGVVRYRLIDYVETGDPYFVGDVIFFEDEDETDEDLQSLADEVYALFERVAKAAFKLSGGRGRFPEIPKTEPEQLSFLVTAAFNLDNPLKYQMLETTSTSDRLEKLRDILNQAVNKMEDSAEIHKIAQTNGHSSKKIDL